MSVSEQTQRFMQLFRGRTDALGTDAGGCVRTVVCDVDYERHLTGQTPIGIYPVTDDGTCAWGCVDIDFDDYGLAFALATCIEALRIDPHIEVSRSKGYHVWVFAGGPVPALTMRHALQAACQIIGYSPKEVNPKQAELRDGQLGNYVRLPYPGVLGAFFPQRQVMIDADRRPVYFDRWLEYAWAHRNSRQMFEDAAALYVEPPKPKPVIIDRVAYEQRQLGELTDQLSGLGWTIYNDGPLEGMDRSGTLAKLAHECARCGINPTDAYRILEDADLRWGKYHNRLDKHEQLSKLIQAAY